MWFKYFLIGLFAADILANISMIGEESKPLTFEKALLIVILESFLIWGIVRYFK